jgi:hypothetical protein
VVRGEIAFTLKLSHEIPFSFDCFGLMLSNSGLLEQSKIMKKSMVLLRWAAVLPVALLGSLLASYPLHIILYLTLTQFCDPYPELPERILFPFIFASSFIWIGSKIAPAFKNATSIILFGLYVFMYGGAVFLVWAGSPVFGGTLSFQASGIGVIMAITGAIFGVFMTLKANRDKKIFGYSNMEDELTDFERTERSRMNIAKTVVLSAIFFLALLILVILINIGLLYLSNNVVFNVLNWFNGLSFFWEMVILPLGGGILFAFIFYLFTAIGSLIKIGLFYFLPANSFTGVSAFVLAVLNIVFDCYHLWKSASYFNFLVVIELIVLSFMVVAINFTILTPLPKEN